MLLSTWRGCLSGNVMYLPADRVRPLDITIGQTMALVT